MGEHSSSLRGKLKLLFSFSSLLPLLCILCTALLVYNVSLVAGKGLQQKHVTNLFWISAKFCHTRHLLSVHYHHQWHKRLTILRQFTGMAFYYWTINISPFPTTFCIHSIWQNQQCLILHIIITIIISIVFDAIKINTSSLSLKWPIPLSALVHIHCDKANSRLLRTSSSCQRHFSWGDSSKTSDHKYILKIIAFLIYCEIIIVIKHSEPHQHQVMVCLEPALSSVAASKHGYLVA